MSSDAHSGGELFVIAGPSGSGKTSLIAALLERHSGLALSVSDTTRPPRAGEIDGEHYHFISEDEFRAGVAEGVYLEHASVFGRFYGTRRDRVEAMWKTGRDVLLEIDVQGAEQVRRAHRQTCAIFILPPSLEELEKRLRGRGSDSDDVITRRLGEARREIAVGRRFDWLVPNDRFDDALADLLAVVRAWPRRNSAGQPLIEELLDARGNNSTMKD
ncbi:MAG TPA: guanylate kinase [Wenzhouxiangella sp.]|nr:guanylate kinase [Wenzhouxiangella sp.]